VLLFTLSLITAYNAIEASEELLGALQQKGLPFQHLKILKGESAFADRSVF
jgi:hypothetical protein